MFIVQCDSCDNDRPARLWKATTIHQPPSAEPVALGVYCSLECAQRAPSGSPAAARARLDFILKVEGRNAGTRLWQRLIDAYPQPVPCSMTRKSALSTARQAHPRTGSPPGFYECGGRPAFSA